MGGMILIDVNEVIFFTYIGFSIAAFAFLCSYLMFPRAILTDLTNLKKSENTPCITDWRCVALNNDNVISIINFFHEIDIITFTILLYLLFSIGGVICCISVYYGILSEIAGQIIVSIIALIYFLLIIFLLKKDILKKDNERGKYYVNVRGEDEKWDLWKGKMGRKFYVKLIYIYLCIFIIGNSLFLWIFNNGVMLFLFYIFYLMILLITYLLPIAKRRPVSKMLELWIKEAEVILTPEKNMKE